MSGRIIPESAKRADWPRLVSQSHRDHENRLNTLEGGGVTRAKGRFLYG